MLPSLIIALLTLGIIVGLARFTLRAFEESPHRRVAAFLAVAGYLAVGYGVKAVLSSTFPTPEVTPGDLASLHRAQLSIFATWAACALGGSAGAVAGVIGVQRQLGGSDAQGGGGLMLGVFLAIVCGALVTLGAARWESRGDRLSAEGAPQTAAAQAQDEGWLLGTWELAFDPDKSPTDYMVFGPGNRFESRQAGEVQGPVGTFVLEDAALHISVPIGERTVKLDFQVSATKDRLTKADGAYYAKTSMPIPRSSIFKSADGACPAAYILESGYCVHGGIASPATAGKLVEDYRRGAAPPPIPH